MARLDCSINTKGFSLLEIVTAVGVLSTGIIVILQAFAFSARVTGVSCNIINAVLLAEDKIQELEFKEGSNRLGNEPREASGKKDKFAWRYVFALDSDLNLYKLNFNVSWQNLNRTEEIKLNTYLR